MTGWIETVEQTGSTNDDMLARARSGANEGDWLRAGRQTGGRGRHGRYWSSEPGNLFASTLVRLRANDPAAPSLALVAAVALQECLTVAAPGPDVRIKWPNDLVVGEAKLSGILLERQEDAVIAGFGVNLRSAPVIANRATVSVATCLGVTPDAGVVLTILSGVFATWLAAWRAGGIEPVRRRWLAKAHPVGTALRVQVGEEQVDGLFAGLDHNGSLLLQTAETVRTVHAGDVFLI